MHEYILCFEMHEYILGGPDLTSHLSIHPDVLIPSSPSYLILFMRSQNTKRVSFTLKIVKSLTYTVYSMYDVHRSIQIQKKNL